MLFSSTTFLFLFFPMLFLLYYSPLCKKREWKNYLLLIASLGFYAWGEPVFVFLLIISIILTWYLGKKIGDSKSKKLMIVATVYHVSILFAFKYLSFLSQQLGLLLNRKIDIAIKLPIGISFFTFQLMSYVFDVYYGKVKAQKNLLYLGLYVSFFPQLIAGPIVRYSDIEDQIEHRIESKGDVAEGLRRFIYGLGKKLLIADYMAIIVDYAFNRIGTMSVGMAWFGAIAYSLQIYFDFSGYSDMAIGLGKIFGFSFNENFNYPYISKSITEFWKRWHISLSTWFRDYVYIPLGGNRVSKAKWIRNIFIVWLLTGIWHGANWTFLLWGLIYFVFLMFEKLSNIDQRIGRFSYIGTAFVVIINWVIFRADNVSQAWSYIKNMFGFNASNGIIDSGLIEMMCNTGILFLAAVIGATPIVKKGFDFLNRKKYGWIEDIWLVIVLFVALINAVAATYTPFIYFNF